EESQPRIEGKGSRGRAGAPPPRAERRPRGGPRRPGPVAAAGASLWAPGKYTLLLVSFPGEDPGAAFAEVRARYRSGGLPPELAGRLCGPLWEVAGQGGSPGDGGLLAILSWKANPADSKPPRW
ncbi:unnamed protein product, partial [Prorocentrum cordatum]